MADFGDYAPNRAPTDALIVRQTATADHAVVPYSGEDLSRPAMGPANPFREDTSRKRKNVLTGTAEEVFVSEHTFRSKHRAVERGGGPEREYQTNAQAKAEAARIRATREREGDATIAEGDGAYVGPWRRYKRPEYDEVEGEEALGSDDEYEVVEVTDDEDVVESGTVLRAPAEALARRKEVEELGEETTQFHGPEERDYQGRTYMHVPTDLGVNLRNDVGSVTNFIPKKLFYSWTSHPSARASSSQLRAITGLEFFPNSGHLLLSAGADSVVRIWDVYHERNLLRTYSGHSKAISGIDFNADGTQFVSAGFDRHIKLWDTETGACLNRFSSEKGTPHVIKFNPNPEYRDQFLVGTSKKIMQFDTRTREVQQSYEDHLAAINSLTFCDEGRRFMSTSMDNSLLAYEVGIPVPIKRVSEPDMFSLTRAAAHPSGKYVAYQSSDNQVLVYQSTDKMRQNRKKSYRGHNTAGSAIDLSISPDGQFLASGDTSGWVCFWDWKTCKMYHKVRASQDQAVTCVRWHPQETSKVVTAGMEGVIKLWD